MEVIYQGIRLTPEQIAAVAVEEDVDVVGLSILSGSHLELVPAVVRLLREGGVEAPVVAGGIVPEEDRPPLLDAGVAAVYTPKDFELARIMGEIVDLAVAGRGAEAQAPRDRDGPPLSVVVHDGADADRVAQPHAVRRQGQHPEGLVALPTGGRPAPGRQVDRRLAGGQRPARQHGVEVHHPHRRQAERHQAHRRVRATEAGSP